VIDFINTYKNDAAALASVSGVNADFLLAWAARESGYGVDPAPTLNNNYFGLTAQGDGTGGWIGAVPCSTVPGEHHPGHACFGEENGAGFPGVTGTGFSQSGFAALFSQNGKYQAAILAAQNQNPGDTVAIGDALGGAGFNANGHYGTDIKEAGDAIDRRKNCPN